MDYDDNDFQSQNLHLAGEGNNKFPPVLRQYALPRFDFDDNLHGHLRFDSLVETEVFLGIESSEDNQWIEDFSRGGTGIAFSSSAAEPCSISRRNNVWSEAASSESVEMLLKSVGQDESIPGQTITKGSDACDELGCIIKQMEPSLKHGDSSLSKVGNDSESALQAVESPGKISELKGDVGDHRLVEDVCQAHDCNPSVDVKFSDPNIRNTDLPVTDRAESKDSEQVFNENQVEATVDQSVDNRGVEDKFASGSQVDAVIPSVQNTSSGTLIDNEDAAQLKNDIIIENKYSLERENVDSSQEVKFDGENLVENAVASIHSPAKKHSTLDKQAKGDRHAIGHSIATMSEPFDSILKGNSELPMVEGCREGSCVENPMQTGTPKDVDLSEGILHDISPPTFVVHTTLKEHESVVSDTDTRTSMSLEPKMDSTVQIPYDAVGKKDLLESACHPDTKILSSKSDKSLLLVEDGKRSKGEVESAQSTLGAEPGTVCEEYIASEHNDDYEHDQSGSAAAKQKSKQPSDCSNADCGDNGSPLVKGPGGTAIELAANSQSGFALSSKSVDHGMLRSSLHTVAVFDQKEVQVSSPEANFSIMKTSEVTMEKGAPRETNVQFSSGKVDQSLLVKDTSNAEGQCSDQTLGVKDMQASSVVSDSMVRGVDGAEAQAISKRGSLEAAAALSIQDDNNMSTDPVLSTSKEPSDNTGQNHPEVPSYISEEKISSDVAVQVDETYNSSLTSVPSSESQLKYHVIESGSSNADVEHPQGGSPVVIRNSGQSQGKTEKDSVKGSKDQIASMLGVNKEAKAQSICQDSKGNDVSPGDTNFTFEVPPLANLSEKEAGKNWQLFSIMQHDKTSLVVEGTPSTSGTSKAGAKTVQADNPANLQASGKGNVRGGSRGTSERKTRRASGKTAGKEAAKKRSAAKETTPARQLERSDRTSNVSLSSSGIGQLMQSNEMQHYGRMEVFHQPFTDMQQVQLRAQIFVYGALIQGTAPDEAYMASAFGGPDGGRTIWENAWRACVERAHGQKSHLASPETPLQTRIGAKTSDQSVKQNVLQSIVTSSPASRSTSKATPTTIVNPMIPLSSPLWSIPTPSGDALQSTGIPRGAVLDYQQAISPLHPPPIRNFVGHNAPWMSQSHFRGPWVPQTSAFDGNARFPVLSTETVNLTPVREASVPHSSSVKQASTVPMVQSGVPSNVFAGTPLPDTKKATITSSQRTADSKPRKRKKSTVSEDPGQNTLHSPTDTIMANVTSHASTSAITTPATIVSKLSTDKFITSAHHPQIGDQDSNQQVSTVPVVQSGAPANMLAGTPLLDTKKATITSSQLSADPKPRKRKKSTVSEDPGQIILHSQADTISTIVVTSHASTTAAITTPATTVSKLSMDKFVTADHLKRGDQDSDQRAILSEETISKLKEAQKQAEDSAALAAAAVSQGQEIWSQLDKQKNSGLAPDVETKLSSAAAAIAAAAAVAKAAAAAAYVASNAALQAKFMADEALVSSGYGNSNLTNAVTSDGVKKLGKATPASILRGEDSNTSSNSVIVAAREAARRRVEATLAASKRAENMDAIVKAAEVAAEAVSQAGKIVAMGEPFSLSHLVEAGPDAYWKASQVSPGAGGAIREHMDKSGSVEAPSLPARLPEEASVDNREKQNDDRVMSPTLREIARESMEDRSRTDGMSGVGATSGKERKGQKGHKASDVAKSKGLPSESEIGIGSPCTTTQTEDEKAAETSKHNNIREGAHVEVLRDGGNLKVAWFMAKILNLKDDKAYVCYDEFQSQDGDRLKEWVQLDGEGDRAPKIRSARPVTAMPFEGTRKRRRAAMGDYNWSIGDRVDAWMQDSWWEGVITEKNKKDATSLTVHFPAQGETSVVKAWLLRPSLTWKSGSWVEWSSSQDNNSAHEGDTPQEKRPRIGSPLGEAKGKDKLPKNADVKEPAKPDNTRLLDLTASEKVFNIGKSDSSDSLRMIRTGLKKEGSRVIFGVPKPGKKRKFMEVSKHYIADQSSKTHETSDMTKLTKYMMPQASEPRGTKNKIEPKEKRMAVTKPKVLKSGKPPSVSSRTLRQKDSLSSTLVSQHDDAVAADVSKFKDSGSQAENISGKHNMMEFRSFSSSDGAAEGPVLFTSSTLSTDAPPKKTSTSNAKSERIIKGKLAPAAGKFAKIEEKTFNATKTISEVVEPRRSIRRIQPTSRLLEGLQSSLIVSKIPSISHDKSHKTQSRSTTRGNNQR